MAGHTGGLKYKCLGCPKLTRFDYNICKECEHEYWTIENVLCGYEEAPPDWGDREALEARKRFIEECWQSDPPEAGPSNEVRAFERLMTQDDYDHSLSIGERKRLEQEEADKAARLAAPVANPYVFYASGSTSNTGMIFTNGTGITGTTATTLWTDGAAQPWIDPEVIRQATIAQHEAHQREAREAARAFQPPVVLDQLVPVDNHVREHPEVHPPPARWADQHLNVERPLEGMTVRGPARVPWPFASPARQPQYEQDYLEIREIGSQIVQRVPTFRRLIDPEIERIIQNGDEF